MNLADTNLAELLNRLSPRDRRLLSDALRPGGQLTGGHSRDSSMASQKVEASGSGGEAMI
jgi:hypothetical protein